MYTECDQVTYNKANVRLLVAGSKAWEMEHLQDIFSLCPVEMLKEMFFLFNLTYEEHQKDIRDNMMTSKNESLFVEFLPYKPYPYTVSVIPGMNTFLEAYLPKIEPEKKGFFRKGKGKA